MQFKNTFNNTITTSVDIGTMSKKGADKFKSKVEGKTYYKFRVITAPINGSLWVTVETDYDFSNSGLSLAEQDLEVATMVARLLLY